jgi:hypothetical protein
MFDYKQIQKRVDTVFGKEIFFVFGYPKSGTTWVQHLLNGHPEIWCGGESLFTRLLPLLKDATNLYNEQVTQINEVRLQNRQDYAQFTEENLDFLFVTAIGLLFSNLTGDSPVKCIGDKTPEYLKANELFADLFPYAKFIHIIRDGRDVTISGWFQNLRLYGEDYKKRYPDLCSYIADCAQEWVCEIREARSFEQTHPDHYLELRYEDLHLNFDLSVQRMLKFLDVDASGPMIEQCRNAGAFSRFSQNRQPGEEDRVSFFRKGVAGDWKNYYDQSCLDTFMQYGGGLLRELGYE